MPDPVHVLAIVGPTASGKSALAIEVALRSQPIAEIVGTDSMQVYRGMAIGTAAPTPNERRGIRHHMVDMWEPSRAVTVMEFQEAARAAIAEIVASGHPVVVVGGSGLYVSAVLDDLAFPGTDPQVRARLEGDLAEQGAEAMHSRLAAVDPQAAQEILPTNGRRIVRALEVVEITGEPFVARLPEPSPVVPAVRVGMRIPREVLDRRITERVDRMWADGFVEEVRMLAANGLSDAPTASRALGYQQVLDYLAGRISEGEARQQTIDATRRFARRQDRWFRRDARITWLDYDSPTLVDDTVRLWASGTAT